MMPYLVTTKRACPACLYGPNAGGEHRPESISRVAYAKPLDEVGGIVDPPDGTTIEVEDLSLVEMYRRAGFEWDAHGPDAMVGLPEVLAAFNEANR